MIHALFGTISDLYIFQFEKQLAYFVNYLKIYCHEKAALFNRSASNLYRV